LKYYLIAGEASGDLHGANLIKALRQNDSNAEIRAWGGDAMQAAGAQLVKHYRDLSFMGFIEVLAHLRTILRNLAFCKSDLEAFQPNVLVLIDYPGFNLRIAEHAYARGMRVVYYISPQVWAWKARRTEKIKRSVHRMLTILPFEQEFYRRKGMEVDFVGHPLLDAIAKRPSPDAMQRKGELGLAPEGEVIALLPGSRTQEIKTMLPLMLKAAAGTSHQIAVAGAPSQDDAFYHGLIAASGVKATLISNRTYDLLEIAHAAMVTSGTATLETALFEVPQVVCYRGSAISYAIARKMVQVKYISLVNLILDQAFLTELIQQELNLQRLQEELQRCLNPEQASYFHNHYQKLKTVLGGPGASQKAADIITEEAQHG